MSSGRIWFLALTATAAVAVSAFISITVANLRGFAYTDAGLDDVLASAFFGSVGALSIPWTVLLIIFLIPQRWRTQ